MDAMTTSGTVPFAHEQKKQDGGLVELSVKDGVSTKVTNQDGRSTEQDVSSIALTNQDAVSSKQGAASAKFASGSTAFGPGSAELPNQDGRSSEFGRGSAEFGSGSCEQDGGSAELTHEELMEVTSTALNDLLKSVTILADLPQHVTLEEVNAQIAVQHGQSITVYAVREDGEEIPAVVNQRGAKVIDLKHAIRRAVDLKVKRAGKSGDRRKISWKYVWKTNQLCFEGERLANDQALLVGLGIRNKARVTFVKRLREKGTVVR